VLARDADGAPAFLSIPAAKKAALQPPADADLHVGDLIAVVPAEATAFPEKYAKALYVVAPNGVKAAPQPPKELGGPWLATWGQNAYLMLGASKGVDRRRITLAACDCADTALYLTSDAGGRPRKAIETTRAWCFGRASIDDVRSDSFDAACAASSTNAPVSASAASASAHASTAAFGYASAAAADAAHDAAAARGVTYLHLSPLVERWIPLPVVLLSRLGYPDAIPFDPAKVLVATRENGRRARARRAAATAVAPNPGAAQVVDREYRDPMLDHRLFIRFGAFGDEASRVRLDPEFRNEVLDGKNFEAGLSVYAARRFVAADGTAAIAIEPPDLRRAAYHERNATSYFRHMLRGFASAIANDRTYLVTGDVVGETYVDVDFALDQTVRVHRAVLGSDGEPLLEPSSVRVVQPLTTDDVLAHLWWDGSVPLGQMRMELSSRPLHETVWDYVDEEDEEALENPPRVTRWRPRR
jgi:hypothetical protein